MPRDYLKEGIVKNCHYQAQEWLDEDYPIAGVCQRKDKKKSNHEDYGKARKDIIHLNISSEYLIGTLDLTGFVNLESLDCSHNNLTSLDISNCKKITKISCHDNKLTTLLLPLKADLTEIKVWKNSLNDLTTFSHYVNLEFLSLGDNPLVGSLELLKNCHNLKYLGIKNTKLTFGLEYLPDSLKEFYFSGSPLAEILEPHQGNVQTWRKYYYLKQIEEERAKVVKLENELVQIRREGTNILEKTGEKLRERKRILQTKEQEIINLQNQILTKQDEINLLNANSSNQKKVENLQQEITKLQVLLVNKKQELTEFRQQVALYQELTQSINQKKKELEEIRKNLVGKSATFEMFDTIQTKQTELNCLEFQLQELPEEKQSSVVYNAYVQKANTIANK